MRTNTRYARSLDEALTYNPSFITIGEAAEMTAQMLDAHFANISIKSSAVHVITKNTYKKWDRYHQFPVRKINKRYRLPKRI